MFRWYQSETENRKSKITTMPVKKEQNKKRTEKWRWTQVYHYMGDWKIPKHSQENTYQHFCYHFPQPQPIIFQNGT